MQLRSEDFNAQEILSGVTDIRAYLGMIETEDVLGITMDYKNKTCTRIAGAKNLTAGADFDKFSMYGGRKRCNVSDGGTINAYYGDEGYTEDGSNGQVMVYQPKFYYLVCPLEYDRQETGYGYHLRKANYYISETQRGRIQTSSWHSMTRMEMKLIISLCQHMKDVYMTHLQMLI